MATRTWLDVNGDWSDTSNWSGGSAPTTSDTALVLEGNKDIVSNLTTTMTTGTLVVGRGFRGTIGTSTDPLILGVASTFAKVVVDAPQAGTLNFKFDTACTDFVITNTGTGTYACHLHSGTVTNMYLSRGRLRVNANATITNHNQMYFTDRASDSYTYSEASATFATSVVQSGGVFDSYSSIDGTLNVSGGRFNLLSDADRNIANLKMWGGLVVIDANGATLPIIDIRGGTCTGERSLKPATFAGTSAAVYAGGALLVNNEVDTVSNAVTVAGGIFNGDSRTTVYSNTGPSPI